MLDRLQWRRRGCLFSTTPSVFVKQPIWYCASIATRSPPDMLDSISKSSSSFAMSRIFLSTARDVKSWRISSESFLQKIHTSLFLLACLLWEFLRVLDSSSSVSLFLFADCRSLAFSSLDVVNHKRQDLCHEALLAINNSTVAVLKSNLSSTGKKL